MSEQTLIVGSETFSLIVETNVAWTIITYDDVKTYGLWVIAYAVSADGHKNELVRFKVDYLPNGGFRLRRRTTSILFKGIVEYDDREFASIDEAKNFALQIASGIPSDELEAHLLG